MKHPPKYCPRCKQTKPRYRFGGDKHIYCRVCREEMNPTGSPLRPKATARCKRCGTALATLPELWSDTPGICAMCDVERNYRTPEYYDIAATAQMLVRQQKMVDVR